MNYRYTVTYRNFNHCPIPQQWLESHVEIADWNYARRHDLKYDYMFFKTFSFQYESDALAFYLALKDEYEMTFDPPKVEE